MFTAFFMPCSWLCYAWRKETYLPFSCLVPHFVTLEGRKHICLFHALSSLCYTLWNIFAFFMPCSSLSDAWRKETYLPFSCLVPAFMTLWGMKHISLFHALFPTLLRLKEGNIFPFFMPCPCLSDTLRKETYFPFSCLVPDFVTLEGRKHIFLFHILFLTLLHSMKHISLFHAPAGSIFPLVSSFF